MSQREPRMDAVIIKQQIDHLLLAFPDLAEDDILRADMVEAETSLHEFLRVVERKREDAEAMAAAVAMTIDDLKARKRRFEQRDVAMRTLMFTALQWADLRKAELPEATLSIRNGVPRVIIVDEAILPKECIRVKTEPDKIIIGEMLKAGDDVPGAVLANVEPVLAIRTK